jgi:basic amino acid/polyamine antiporter, APA family
VPDDRIEPAAGAIDRPVDGQVQRRPLRLVHVFAISTGAMFSSGFFLLPGLAADETGPSLPLAYLLAGLLVVPALLSAAELSTAMPHAGGPYHFIRRSLGPAAAIVGALGLWVAMILKAAFALVGVGAYLTLVLDVPIEPVAAGLAVVFTALNILGAKESAGLQIVLVAVLLAVLVAFTASGVVEVVAGTRPDLGEAFSPFFTDGIVGLFAATGMVFVSYAGLLQVASVAGEVDRPERTIPRGLMLSLATATVFYVAGTFLMVAVLQPEELRDDETPVATAVEAFALPLGLWLVIAAALAAFASTGNAGIMSASRYPLALASDGLLWSRFGRLGRFGTPTLAVILTGAVTAAAVLLLEVDGIAKAASAVLLVVFAMLHLAVVILRRSRVPDYQPPFRAPLYPWTQLLGVVASIVLLLDLGALAVGLTVGVVTSGLAWYAFHARTRVDDPGAAVRAFRRARTRPLGLDALEDVVPRSADRAPELLERAVVTAVEPGADLDEVVDVCARSLAHRMGVGEEVARRWVHSSHLLDARSEGGALAIHEVLIDAGREPAVAVAWSPRDSNGGGAGDAGDRHRGPTAVVVIGPVEQRERMLRVAGLLATQLDDQRLADAWPTGGEGDRHDGARDLLVRDAIRRQGGDPHAEDPPAG